MVTIGTRKKLLAVGLVLGMTALGTSAAVIAQKQVLAPPVDTSIKVDSFASKHIVLQWVVQWRSDVAEGKIVVGMDSATQKLLVKTGAYTDFGQVVLDRETATPACSGNCFVPFGKAVAESRPGGTFNGNQMPVTSWVGWWLDAPIPLDGTSKNELEVKVPGIFGEWTMTTRHGGYVYDGTSYWGSTYTYTEGEPETVVFQVKQEA